MATLSIDEQVNALCATLDKTPKVTKELKDHVIHYLEQYIHLASPEVQQRAILAVEAKLGIDLQQALARVPDTGDEPLISPVFPTRGWLGDYLQYTERHEAPDIFHFWVGITIMHAAIRRNIFFEHGYYRIFPNSYVILVAPPGVCKKSTATNIGVELLQELPDVTIIREKITPEALIETLATTMRVQSKSGLHITPSAC